MKKEFSLIFYILFAVSIITALAGRVICIRDTRNYDKPQPEFRGPDVIADVFGDTKSEMIYVCYGDASYVNVYSFSGEFLWAVSTPYMRNASFAVDDGKLYIYDYEAYVYDDSDGSFIEHIGEGSLTFYDELDGTEYDEDSDITYNAYNVFITLPDGSVITIVERPWWYWLTNFIVCWCAAMLCGLCIGISIFLDKKRGYKRVRHTCEFKNRRTKVIYNYFRIMSAVNIVYAVANIVVGFYGGILIIGCFPVVIHFILSSIVLYNLIDATPMSYDERTAIDYWKTVSWASIIMVFISVFIATEIAAAIFGDSMAGA